METAANEISCLQYTKNPRHKRATQRSTESTLFTFSLDPKALGDLRLQALGGIRGLEEGLRTDILAGLSLDETYLDDPGKVPANIKNAESADKNSISESAVSSGLRCDTFIDRKTFFGDNRLPTRPAPSFLSLVWSAYNDHALFLLTGAAVISLALGLYQTFGTKHYVNNLPVEWVEGVSILVAIFGITLAGAANDYHKEYKFRKLNKRQQDRNVWVLRSGRVHEVPIAEVVVGDIIHIRPGDVVPADGVLIKGHQVKCDESLATGESDPVSKTAFGSSDADGSRPGVDPFILSHTKIFEGVGSYLVLATGTNSSYGRILLSLDTDPGLTPFQVRLSSLAKNIARFGALVAIALFVILFIKFCVGLSHSTESPSEKGQSFLNLFILALTVIVIAVPEGLPLAVTLALSFATTRMMRDNNLVRQLQACETVGQATDICSDKTGTLTRNEMTVVSGFFCPTSQFTDHAGSPNSLIEGKSSSAATCMGSLADQWISLTRQSIAINSTAVESRHREGRVFLGSQTEAALLRFSQDYLGLGQLDYDRANAEVVDLLPFNASRKFMVSIIKIANGSYRAYIKGAPAALLKKCVATIAEPTQGIEAVPLTEETIGQIRQATRQYASRSLRVIALCFRDLDLLPFMGDGMTVIFEEVMRDLIFHGIIGIQDPLRPDARDAVETSHKAGLVVRMVTGDNVLTAKSVAEECGIISGPDDLVMVGGRFRALSVGQQKRLAPRLKVLARSRPDDKRVLVERLKDLGRVVAVTGDGANDAPALAAADIGFSMGISGTDIAREASSIVLLDDTFSSVVKAIMWGRAVSDAVKKFLQVNSRLSQQYRQMVPNYHHFHLGLSGICVSGSELIAAVRLNPSAAHWVNLFQDTLAALALATDPQTRRILNRKPEPRFAPLITPTMWKMIIGQTVYQMVVTLVLYFAGSSIFSYRSGLQASQLQTAIFNTHVWMQIFNMYKYVKVTTIISLANRQFPNSNRQIERSFNLLEGIHHNWLFIAVSGLMAGSQILIMFSAEGHSRSQNYHGINGLIQSFSAPSQSLSASYYRLFPQRSLRSQ
ncbi:ATPase P-type K/Mg/Cd/Cu/Zn/Na/Ca/Na/H-transporter [Penicillium sp. DV-2018c]|nr:ATPase P-type K/Mg/Cd/Cu/Zn/Na/Ca/Na/H-transporter [Penicillium sp. DV-2018c]